MSATLKASKALLVRDLFGEYREASSIEVINAAREHLGRRVRRGVSFRSPEVVRDYLATRLGELEHEVFILILLDSQHRLIKISEMFRGTIDGASVYPREVVKEALYQNAAAVILVHNHPSGHAEPSAADRALTERLTNALGMVDIRVLDHLVVAGANIVSFAERGWI